MPKPKGYRLLRSYAGYDSVYMQNFPGFQIPKAIISQISELGLRCLERNMSSDSYIQSFKHEKYLLMKNYASWIRFSSVFKFSALSDLFFS